MNRVRSRFDSPEEEKNASPKITKAMLSRILSYLHPYRWFLALVFVLIILSSVLGLLPSVLTGKIIDDGILGENLNLIYKLSAASLIVLLGSRLIGLLQSYVTTWIGQRITYDMKNQMYAHLQNMSQRFFTTQKPGDIVTRMTSDISGAASIISGILTSYFSDFIIIITTVITLYSKSWQLATIGMVMIPLFIIPTDTVGKKRWKLASEAQKKRDGANQVINETLSVGGQLLTKLFTKEKAEYEKFRGLNEEVAKLTVRERMAGRWFWVFMHVTAGIGPIIIYLIGGILIIKIGVPNLTIGDISVIVALIRRLYRPVESVLGLQIDFTRSMALFARIFEYLDMPVEIKNESGAVIPERIAGKLCFDDVHFSYTSDTEVLKGVSFTVEPGKSVAIVGPSGAGKSTIISLIPRLYDVSGGKITIDGRDIRTLDLQTLRSSIGVVTQDTYLFNATIRENLLYAKPDATKEDLERVCRDASIHDFIMTLPFGYDTVVGNRGFKLSGGEKQRISLARMILKDPKILILDEATSSLDSISEKAIQNAITPLLVGRTSIIIAHRLSTIISADEILVIENGCVSERGTHAQLLAHSGTYQTLYNTQFCEHMSKS